MLSVHVYDAQGRHIGRIPADPPSWRQTVSRAGGMTVGVPDSRQLRRLPLGSLLREYGSVWSVQDGRRVRHAGWLLHCKATDEGLSLDVGDGWSIWDKRLVVRHGLMGSWHDGEVVIDEQHPPGDWVLTLTGTYRDIARGLLAEALKFGALPYRLPDPQGGSAHVRDYDSWDFAPVGQRLSELAGLEDGPEIRFDPLVEGDRLVWRLTVGEPEIVDSRWRMDLDRPGDRVTVTGLDVDGGAMTGEVFGLGGRKEDTVLVAHTSSACLADRGWPVLQSADTSHSTVSVLGTLQSHLADELRSGCRPQTTVGLRCPIGRDIHVGDWLDLKAGPAVDAGLSRMVLTARTGPGTIPLKVTDIAADPRTGWQDLQTRVRW